MATFIIGNFLERIKGVGAFLVILDRFEEMIAGEDVGEVLLDGDFFEGVGVVK